MKNFIEEGKTIDYVIPADKTVASGEMVAVGDIVGIAIAGGNAGDIIALAVNGVFELPKGNSALEQGKKAYLNDTVDTGKTVVSTEAGNTFIGYVWKATAAGSATVEVKLSI